MKTLKQYSINFVTLKGLSETTTVLTNQFGINTFNGVYINEKDLLNFPMSESWQMDTLARLEAVDNNSEVNDKLSSIIVFKFGKELKTIKKRVKKQALKEGKHYKVANQLAKEAEERASRIVDKAFKHGIKIQWNNGTETEYQRYLRTPSGLRAGGGIFSITGTVDERRFLFSLGVNVDGKKDIPAKWESKIGLSVTNSHVINGGRKIKIRIVPDIQRLVEIDTKELEEYTEEEMKAFEAQGINPNTEEHVGLDSVKYSVLSKPEDGKPSTDIQFNVVDGKRTKKIETVDGGGIGTPEIFEYFAKCLQLTAKEKVYACAFQIRAPYMKGMIAKAHIKEYCDDYGIDKLVDIYGEEFDPRKVDLILPESMFKGAGLFNNMSEYYDLLEGTVPVKGKDFKLFENHEWFRIANINKEKEEMHEVAYQYLQALVHLNKDSLKALAKDFMDTVKSGVLKDPAVAKKFLGMVYRTQDGNDYNKSMVAKAQELMELHPLMFQCSMVQKQIKDCVEKSFLDLGKGRIPLYGNYHFIMGDVSLLFINTPEFFKSRTENGDPKTLNTLLSEEDGYGLLKKGEQYLKDFVGESVLARSPLIHFSEIRKALFAFNAEFEKYFGAKGVIFMNSHEPLALCMGGADYDGDKVYKTEVQALLDAILENMPIIISPLESYKPNSKIYINDINADRLYELDCRTLDNQTGIFTNMGTYYINEYYHVKYTFEEAYNIVSNPQSTPQQRVEILNRFFPGNAKITDTNQLLFSLNAVKESKLKELDYKITIIRICQAGEIDFPKHGVRFVMPDNVATMNVLHWHSPSRFDEINATLRSQGKPELPKLDTPLERLHSLVEEEWNTLKKELRQAKMPQEVITCMQGGIDRFNPEFVRLYPLVQKLEAEYSQKLTELGAYCRQCEVEEEERSALYKSVYDYYINEVGKLTIDRQTLASVCVTITFIEKVQNNSFSFPFVVAYDGILMNLAKYTHSVPRVIPMPSLDKHKDITGGTIIIREGKAIHNATGLIYDLPSTIVVSAEDKKDDKILLPDGEYNIKTIKGKHYIEVNYTSTDEEKELMVKHYYEKQDEIDTNVKENELPKVHVIKAVKDVNHEISIVGLNRNGMTSDLAIAHIQQNMNKITFKDVTTDYNGTATNMVGVYVKEQMIGSITYKDKVTIRNNNYVDMTEFYNKIINVTSMKSTGKYGIKMTVHVTSTHAFTEPLDDVHIYKCNMNHWYWNLQWVEFNTFEGFEYKNTQLATMQLENSLTAKVNITFCGVPHSIWVSKNEHDEFFIYSITNDTNNMPINIQAVPQEFLACALRKASYMYHMNQQ